MSSGSEGAAMRLLCRGRVRPVPIQQWEESVINLLRLMNTQTGIMVDGKGIAGKGDSSRQITITLLSRGRPGIEFQLLKEEEGVRGEI